MNKIKCLICNKEMDPRGLNLHTLYKHKNFKKESWNINKKYSLNLNEEQLIKRSEISSNTMKKRWENGEMLNVIKKAHETLKNKKYLPWNKGLTKENDNNVLKISVKMKNNKNRNTGRTRFKKGQITWNKGLTKKTDIRVRKYGEKTKGKKKPLHSLFMKNYILKNGPTYPKAWFVSELNHKVRSNWEKDIGLELKKNNEIYEYEKPYLLIWPDESRHYYYADFTLTNKNIVIEGKGFFKCEKDKLKLKLFIEQYLYYRFIIIVDNNILKLDNSFEIYNLEDFKNNFKNIIDNKINVNG